MSAEKKMSKCRTSQQHRDGQVAPSFRRDADTRQAVESKEPIKPGIPALQCMGFRRQTRRRRHRVAAVSLRELPGVNMSNILHMLSESMPLQLFFKSEIDPHVLHYSEITYSRSHQLVFFYSRVPVQRLSLASVPCCQPVMRLFCRGDKSEPFFFLLEITGQTFAIKI